MPKHEVSNQSSFEVQEEVASLEEALSADISDLRLSGLDELIDSTPFSETVLKHFDQWDVDGDGHLSNQELSIQQQTPGLDVESKAALDVLSTNNDTLENRSDDEFLWDNNGVTQQDIASLGPRTRENLTLQRDYDVARTLQATDLSELESFTQYFDERLEATDRLTLQDIETLKSLISDLSNPVQQAWAERNLEALLDPENHIEHPDRSVSPANEVVARLISSDFLDQFANRYAEATNHPVLDGIRDAAAKEQMQEFLQRYMTDSVLWAASKEDGLMNKMSSAVVGSGTTNNFVQSTSHLPWSESHPFGSGKIDKYFGGCVECQQRVEDLLKEFKEEWEARTDNLDQSFLLEGAQVRATGAFEHNWMAVTVESGGTYYIDPWTSQDNNSESVMNRSEVLRDYADGTAFIGLGKGNITTIREGDTVVYDPSDSYMNIRNLF